MCDGDYEIRYTRVSLLESIKDKEVPKSTVSGGFTLSQCLVY